MVHLFKNKSQAITLVPENRQPNDWQPLVAFGISPNWEYVVGDLKSLDFDP